MSVKPPLANSRASALKASGPTPGRALQQAAASQAGKPATRRDVGRKPVESASDAGDQRIVMFLCGIFAAGAIMLIAMSVAASNRTSRAKVMIGETFQYMHNRQAEYRSNNGRFATWPELKASGVALEPRQSVVDSNADASHWFLSIRDRETGVTCDRTGELLDGPVAERQPICREQKAD